MLTALSSDPPDGVRSLRRHLEYGPRLAAITGLATSILVYWYQMLTLRPITGGVVLLSRISKKPWIWNWLGVAIHIVSALVALKLLALSDSAVVVFEALLVAATGTALLGVCLAIGDAVAGDGPFKRLGERFIRGE